MPNSMRAERELKVGRGKNAVTYNLKLDFMALMNIEQDTGLSLGGLMLDNFVTGKLSVTYMAMILHRAIESGGNEITLEEAGELILEYGMTETVTILGDLLTKAFASGDPKEKKPVVTKEAKKEP